MRSGNQELVRRQSGAFTLGRAAALAVLSFALACSEVTGPLPGTLRIYIVTHGDPETGTYELRAASQSRTVAPSSFVSIDGVAPGAHAVELSLPANCSVDGENPRPVVIVSAQVTEVQVTVRCDDTGVEVLTVTNGPDGALLDYEAATSGLSIQVLPNGLTRFPKIPVGTRTVTLRKLPGNCVPVSEPSVTVQIVSRTMTPVRFEVSCNRTADRIVFSSETVTNFQLSRSLLMTATSGNVITTHLASAGFDAAWAPGADRIAYSTTSCDFYYGYCNGGLFMLDLTTREKVELRSGAFGMEPAFSPDGKYLAFAGQTQFSIFLNILDLAADSVIQLHTPGIVVTGGAVWSPDGRTLAFPCIEIAEPADICTMNTDGTGVRRVTAGVGASKPEWSPDGRLIAFGVRRFNEPAEVVVMSPDGSGLTRLAAGFAPSWSPDGSMLVFARADGLFTMQRDGTNITRLTDGRHVDPHWRR